MTRFLLGVVAGIVLLVGAVWYDDRAGRPRW